MKTKISFLITLIAFSVEYVIAQTPCKEIVGYYPNWQWYDRSKLVNPQSIDYSKYTILNYCFMKLETDGTISLTDPWADDNLLNGLPDWQNGGYLPNTSIIELAHNSGVKVLPSIGGWTLSSNFPSVAADSMKRATFAQACVDLIQQYDFDGIDLDWEYPGYIPHSGTPMDKSNFNLLLQAVRTAIDNYGLSVGKTMQLTAAVGASESHMDEIDWPVVEQYLDIINLMSYDFFGAFSSITNHNAPLYQSAQGDPSFNVDSAVTKLVNQYGVNPNKITVGVAFYGRSSKTSGTPNIFVPTTGAVDDVTFSDDAGSPLYYNILNKLNLFSQHWDSQAQVPFLTGNNSLQTFVSYDNEQSISEKAQFIVNRNLRGAIIWEITGDYLETFPGSGVISGTPLVNTINSIFCGTTNLPIITEDELSYNIFPNPATDKFTIRFNSNNKSLPVKIEIRNVFGSIIEERNLNDNRDLVFNNSKLSSGNYLINIIFENKQTVKKIISLIK